MGSEARTRDGLHRRERLGGEIVAECSKRSGRTTKVQSTRSRRPRRRRGATRSGSSGDDASVDAGILRRARGIVRGGGGFLRDGRGRRGIIRGRAPRWRVTTPSPPRAGLPRPSRGPINCPPIWKNSVSATRFGHVLATGWFAANFPASLTDNRYMATISLFLWPFSLRQPSSTER